MRKRINLPTVFLSHSKKNSEFIERLDKDLQRCQINTWLDTNEIRHGESWQDAIFEYGLPTCDAVLVYFTEDSLSSSVVKKEIDAALIHKLGDNNVAFLPYVNDANIRTQLRADIQSIQTPEWNDKNYSQLLSQVVAEIWRSYLERTVKVATNSERIKRMELERELEKSQNVNFFTPAENSEFNFIWTSIDKEVKINVQKLRTSKEKEIIDEYKAKIDLATLIAYLPDHIQNGFHPMKIDSVIRKTVSEKLLKSDKEKKIYYVKIDGFPDITKELLMYGLLEGFHFESNTNSRNPYNTTTVKKLNVASQKYFRFKYWLSFNAKLPSSVDIEIV